MINSPDDFSTYFDTSLSLEQNTNYEIGLIALTCASNRYNITDGEFSYYSYALQAPVHSRVPEGRYSAESFISTFMSLIQSDSSYYELSYEKEIRRFKLHMAQPKGNPSQPVLNFSENLEKFSGFAQIITGSGNFYAHSALNLNAGADQMFIYTDIVESSFVKKSKQPLLAVVPYTPEENLDIFVFQPKHVVYVPVLYKFLQSIQIKIRDSENNGFRFPEKSETTLHLHLRPLISHL